MVFLSQSIPEIPDDLKQLYKTVWEISQKTVLKMAAERGAFIDQSQSLNIHIAEPNYGKLTSMHFYGWKQVGWALWEGFVSLGYWGIGIVSALVTFYILLFICFFTSSPHVLNPSNCSSLCHIKLSHWVFLFLFSSCELGAGSWALRSSRREDVSLNYWVIILSLSYIFLVFIQRSLIIYNHL